MKTVRIDHDSTATTAFSVSVISDRAHLIAKSTEVFEVREHVEVSVGALAPSVRTGASSTDEGSATEAFSESALSTIQIVGHARS